MLDIIKDTLLDGLKLMPFLFTAFLIIELIEHKLSEKSVTAISKSGKFGPIIGSFVGAFPQCGFSVMATNLYITRIISLGTLVSVYLSTSDEMLPILLSEKVNISIIFKILLIKMIIGMLIGFLIDLFLRKNHNQDNIKYEICKDEHCDCEHHLFKSVLKHTINISLFIIFISFILNIVFDMVGIKAIKNILISNRYLGIFLSSLVGLIPNCASSVFLTTLYANGVLSISSLISGLLTGSGVAILVLFKYNKNLRENIKILSIIYTVGVMVGICMEFLRINL